jgi:hypothetical protein
VHQEESLPTRRLDDQEDGNENDQRQALKTSWSTKSRNPQRMNSRRKRNAALRELMMKESPDGKEVECNAMVKGGVPCGKPALASWQDPHERRCMNCWNNKENAGPAPSFSLITNGN